MRGSGDSCTHVGLVTCPSALEFLCTWPWQVQGVTTRLGAYACVRVNIATTGLGFNEKKTSTTTHKICQSNEYYTHNVLGHDKREGLLLAAVEARPELLRRFLLAVESILCTPPLRRAEQMSRTADIGTADGSCAT